MKIELHEIPVRDVFEGYVNSNIKGVEGYGGKLDIRPEYQREFIYKDKQRDEVIRSVQKGFPLNVMYWAKNDDEANDDYTFEVMDGQQRTISVCDYVNGKFSLNQLYFHNLEDEEKQQILDYKFMVYFCEGTHKEKLDWFKVINIAGEQLTNQELRNTIYTGSWLSDARRHFSKPRCVAHQIGKKYLRGTAIRQSYLETVIDWISHGDIEEYMAKHQHNLNANELWLYFQKVINWIEVTFTNYRREMKGVPFGELYNEYGDDDVDPVTLEERIKKLMRNDEVTKKSGIYSYVFTGEEKHLNIRSFTVNQKREVYEDQNGICPICEESFELDEMEADHITPWHEGGKTITDNCQMLCKVHNREKGGK